MIKMLDPKNDVVFQKLFGIKAHKHILISFLNSILRLEGRNAIKDVEFEEKHLDISLIASEKLSILDLHVTTETNMSINVEIQLINQYNMIKRTIFYMSKMLLSQLKKGEDYSCLNRTVTINILNFNYLDGESYIKRYGLFEKTSKKSLTDLLEYIFIELPKFTEVNKDYNNKLHKWLIFLSNPTGKEIEKFMKTDGEIKEAMDVLYKISGDKEAIMLAEMREKAIMDEQSRLNGARKEGKAEGKIEGLKEAILENLNEIGNVPEDLIECINRQDSMEILKYWNKIAVVTESLKEFEEKIKNSMLNI
ncbi:Rpn family recombination-promoting nuclease/putative transposase [Clostridium sp. YIM B02555]|uniref:Rpn family recombination-promoting nuclease/putative transposase n=1 Tax=Clostridium sp. YIM B02555 TaxID=2911968 RepID=UPI001EEED947|nr:Rpn family recombination-promoting nuclease/putative transposase [Clostridium sp. YIM B02555]